MQLHTTHLTQIMKSMVIFSMVFIVAGITTEWWIVCLTSLLVSATIAYTWQRNPADPERQNKATFAVLVLCTLTFAYEGQMQAMVLAIMAMLFGILVVFFSNACLGNWGGSIVHIAGAFYIHAVAMAATGRSIDGNDPSTESPMIYAIAPSVLGGIANATGVPASAPGVLNGAWTTNASGATHLP